MLTTAIFLHQMLFSSWLIPLRNMDGFKNSWKKFSKQIDTGLAEEDSHLIQCDDAEHQKTASLDHQKAASLDRTKQMEISRIKARILDSDSIHTSANKSIETNREKSLENGIEKAKNKGTIGSLVEKLCNFASPNENVEEIARSEPITGFKDDSLVQITPRTLKKKTQTPENILSKVCDTCQHSESEDSLMRTSESSDSHISSEEEWLLEKSSDVKFNVSKMRLKLQGQELSPKKENILSNLMLRWRDLIWVKRSPEKTRVSPIYVSSEAQTEIISNRKRSASGLKEVAKALSL